MFLLLLAACGQGDSGAPSESRLLFSTVYAYPYVSRLAEEFNRTFPEKPRLLVESVSAGALWERAEEGQAVAQVGEPRAGTWTVQLAWAGLAVIVHPQNELLGVNGDTVNAIFVGAVRRWGEAGSSGGEIMPIVPEGGSDLHSRLSEMMLGGGYFAAHARAAPAPWAVAEAVRSDPSAIGLMPCTGGMEGVKVLRVDGEWPTYDAVFQSRYPLRVPILLSAMTEPEGDLADFAGWAQTLSGQATLVHLCQPGGL